jgi:hypothetical protein
MTFNPITGARLRLEISRLRAQGMTQEQVADELKVHRNTVAYHDKRSLMEMNEQDVVTRVEWRDKHLAELHDLKEKLQAHFDDGRVPLKVWDRLLAALAFESKLVGSSAPERVEVSAVKGPGYELLEHSHGLTSGQLEEVYAFMDSLPRAKTLIDLSGFVEQKQLEEGR